MSTYCPAYQGPSPYHCVQGSYRGKAMRCMKSVVAGLLLACAGYPAETVTSLSAPFAFPTSTRVLGSAASVASTGIASQVLAGGGLSIRWTLGQGAASGRIRLSRLDGRVVASRVVRGPQGVVLLDHAAAGIYLATLTTAGTTHCVRIAIGP
jgi:hypothetical protein